MKVLVACEFSGIVREAFKACGHDAWSCDVKPTELPGNHIQADVRTILNDGWDLMIAHPPCTHLSYAGLRWFKNHPERWKAAYADFDFFMTMINAPIPMVCVENTRGFAGKWYRKADQIVHPYQFGHDVTKGTYLWLRQLPKLQHTKVHHAPMINWTKYGKFGHNGHNRSRTFPGIAQAMAEQWGGVRIQQIPLFEVA